MWGKIVMIVRRARIPIAPPIYDHHGVLTGGTMFKLSLTTIAPRKAVPMTKETNDAPIVVPYETFSRVFMAL